MKRVLSTIALSSAFFLNAQNSNMLAVGGTLGLIDVGAMGGVEVEYGKKINSKLMVTASMEVTRYNDFPKFANRGASSGANPNAEWINYIKDNVTSSRHLWTRVNQQIYTIGVNYFPFKSKKHLPYLKTNLGINIQDVLEYGVESVEGYTIAQKYNDVFSQRGATTVVLLPAIGYNYNINEHWAVGSYLAFQLPLIRDNNIFKYGGAGFDEYPKIGLKIMRYF